MRTERIDNGPGVPPDQARLRHVVQEFEAIFISQMLKSMRGKPVQKGILAEGPGHDLARDLHDEELGRALARSGGIGLGAILMAALRRRQEEPGRRGAP